MSLLHNELYNASKAADVFLVELEAGVKMAKDKGYEISGIYEEVMTLLNVLRAKGEYIYGQFSVDC